MRRQPNWTVHGSASFHFWMKVCHTPRFVIWISHLDRVKFSWLGLGGSFLVQLLMWIVFMLGLCLCNVAFGISGMALSAMSGPAHVCSFAMFIFWVCLVSPPFWFGVDYWRVPCTMFGAFGPCGLGDGIDFFSACPRALLVWG